MAEQNSMNSKPIRGIVFDIQHYSIHDGPGIRSTVFLKGCPLRCPWCQNPESWAFEPEMFDDPDGGSMPSNGKDGSGIIGKSMTAEEVFREVKEDGMFYDESEGGVTLSGGEPLAQPQFAREILKLCKNAGFHTTLDTSGYAEWAIACEVLEFVDLVLLDFKHMDSSEHLRKTGVPNEGILENARRIYRKLAIPIKARVPVIPGWNDSVTNIEATARFILDELDRSVPVHLLKFNRLGGGKFERLGRKYEASRLGPQSEDRMTELKRMIEAYGLTVVIGG
jgi:pyruvate formate lyase activating enzyme